MYLSYKKALKAKEKDIFAEYCMRAARITKWLIKENDICDLEIIEELYLSLVDDIESDNDDYDEIGQALLNEIIESREIDDALNL